jgi:hypothetical protein
MATARYLDFTVIDESRAAIMKPPLRRQRQGRAPGMYVSNSPRQIRSRARRRRSDGKNTTAELNMLHKPIAEWDAEELARGRPRAKDGSFGGRPPTWITREVHEEAITRFRQFIRDGMNSHTTLALKTLAEIMQDKELDDKGRPVVPISTKADVAKWLIEQVVGKPTQKVQSDISIRLQGVLASAIITPGVLPAYADAKALASPRSDADWEVDGEDL